MFFDNLEGQTALLFQVEVRKSRGIIWYGVKNATDLWQPVDAGMGRLLKVLVFYEQQDWLEYAQNIDLRMGNSEKKHTVKHYRILITQWVGDAYEKLRGPDYNSRWIRRSSYKTLMILMILKMRKETTYTKPIIMTSKVIMRVIEI